MAPDGGTSKTKEKKAQRDAERRQQKGKKRKADVLEEPQPESTDELQQDFVPLEAKPDTPAKESREKPQKKHKRKANVEDGEGTQSKKPTTAEGEAESTPKSRFIVFVGNLPFSATDDSIREHFKSLSPFTLRHRTDPKTKKSKGFAFLEFENYDRMKTCLKSFHHSLFAEGRDNRGRQKEGRKINVELTAGGGGKAEGRKEKIRAKNQRLEEQRRRRIEQEKKEKARKERKNGAKDGEEEKGKDGGDEGAGEANKGIHPSRLARMQA